MGSGTRPKIDDGKLGIAVLADPVAAGTGCGASPWRDWSAPASRSVPIRRSPPGSTGEAVTLTLLKIQDPAAGVAGADRPAASGRLAIGGDSGRRLCRYFWSGSRWADRRPMDPSSAPFGENRLMLGGKPDSRGTKQSSIRPFTRRWRLRPTLA